MASTRCWRYGACRQRRLRRTLDECELRLRDEPLAVDEGEHPLEARLAGDHAEEHAEGLGARRGVDLAAKMLHAEEEGRGLGDVAEAVAPAWLRRSSRNKTLPITSNHATEEAQGRSRR